MGIPKFKSSIKALFNLRSPGTRTMTWVCVQGSKTDSFREVYKSFNAMYYTSSSSPSSTASSFLSTESNVFSHVEHVPDGAISSQRFFFSPCLTNSIMEEANPLPGEEASEVGTKETGVLKDLCFETEEPKMEMGFCEESVMMAMASEDPYWDFRVSMEEMVEAHGLREWSCLQELLHCYLRLNEKNTHRVIALAFVDLLMNIISEQPTEEEEDGCVEKNNFFPLLPLSLEEC